jgi:hypothetical protein
VPGKTLHEMGVTIRAIMLATHIRIDDGWVDFRGGENGLGGYFFDDHNSDYKRYAY